MQYKKVIWRDGQPINAGYLQQQTQYFETVIEHKNPKSYNWGAWELEFDSDKLTQGEMSLIKGRGMFPDGTLFDINDLPKPPTLNLTIQEIPTMTRVYLGIPVSNDQEIDFNLESQKENTDNLRYRSIPYLCQDITQPSNTHSAFELKMAIPNIHIFLETELEKRNNQLTIPIAQIKLNNAVVVLDQNYWPPCLNKFFSVNLNRETLNTNIR